MSHVSFNARAPQFGLTLKPGKIITEEFGKLAASLRQSPPKLVKATYKAFEDKRPKEDITEATVLIGDQKYEVKRIGLWPGSHPDWTMDVVAPDGRKFSLDHKFNFFSGGYVYSVSYTSPEGERYKSKNLDIVHRCRNSVFGEIYQALPLK